jgi:curved DNA-binding protein CbpA
MTPLFFATRPLGLLVYGPAAAFRALPSSSLLHRLASTLSSSDRRSHYDVLGLTMGASAAEIKAKYYELSKQLHPDRHHRIATTNSGSQDEQRRRKKEMNKRYVRVKEAYDVLKDKAKRAAFDAELTGGSASAGAGWSTTRNARSNDHYYGHTRYSGTQHQASSFHRRPRQTYQSGSAADAHFYNTKHEAYTNTTYRSAQHAGGRDPLGPTPRTGGNYDVPHFDFDKHYHQQRSYDNHRKIQLMKMAQKRFNLGNNGNGGDLASRLEQQRRQSAFHTGQNGNNNNNGEPFLHPSFNPYSRPTRHLLTLTGPRLVLIFSGFVGTIYLVLKNLFF